MAERKFKRIPEPLITCLLPEYEDKHIWWLILQYLQDTGFNHTASAFTLELATKGVKGDELKALPKGALHKHISCLLTRQLVGPSAAAAVLPRSAGTAAQGGSKGKATPQTAAQQEKPDKKLQAAATPRSQKSGCISPMDIDQRHPQKLDQTEHEKHHGHQQQQQQTCTKPAAKAAAGGQEPRKELPAASQQHSAAATPPDKTARQQQDKPASTAVAPAISAAAPAASALPSSLEAAAQPPAAAARVAPPAAADTAPAAMATNASAPAAAVPVLTVSTLPSVTATGEGEDILDFGDAEDEEATPAADLEHEEQEEQEEEPAGSEAIEEGEHQGEEHEQQCMEAAEGHDDTGHISGQQPKNSAQLPHQPSAATAPASDSRPLLKRGKLPIPALPAHLRHSDGKSGGHSRSRSHSKGRHCSYSRSSRSSSPRKRRSCSHSHSRSYDSRSRSRDKHRSSHNRSRSRDRGHTESRSRSRDRGRDSGRYQHTGYQSQWQASGQSSGGHHGRVGVSYNANGSHNKHGTGRSSGRGFVTYNTNKFDSQDRCNAAEHGGGSSYGAYQRGRGRGRYDFNSSSRGGRGGYQQQRGQGRPIYSNAHSSPHADGEHDGPTRAPYHHPEGSEEGEAVPHHMAHSGSALLEHPTSRPGSDDIDYSRGGDRVMVRASSFSRGRGRGRLGRPAGGDDHWQAPAAGGAAGATDADGGSAAAAAAARKAVGKDGGKFDWPPRDASGKPILNVLSSSVAAAADKQGGRLGGRRYSMPMEDRGHWGVGASGGRGPRERFVQPGAGRRQLTLRSGLVVGDASPGGEGNAGGDGVGSIENDRWRADDDGQGSRSQSRERSFKDAAAAASSPRRWAGNAKHGPDRDQEHAPEQQQQRQFGSSDGGASRMDSSLAEAAAAAAAAGGMSGAHVAAKRRISGTGGAMITDLSGATSQDSPHIETGEASPEDTVAAGPTKKPRASSPGVQS